MALSYLQPTGGQPPSQLPVGFIILKSDKATTSLPPTMMVSFISQTPYQKHLLLKLGDLFIKFEYHTSTTNIPSEVEVC